LASLQTHACIAAHKVHSVDMDQDKLKKSVIM
jgi:hypothetical protein